MLQPPRNHTSFPPDLVLYCEAFLTTYRTFITPEELIKKLQYRYPSHPRRRPGLEGRGPCRAAGREAAMSSFGASGRASSVSLLPLPKGCGRCAVPGTEASVTGGDDALRAGTWGPCRDPASWHLQLLS